MNKHARIYVKFFNRANQNREDAVSFFEGLIAEATFFILNRRASNFDFAVFQSITHSNQSQYFLFFGAKTRGQIKPFTSSIWFFGTITPSLIFFILRPHIILVCFSAVLVRARARQALALRPACENEGEGIMRRAGHPCTPKEARP